MLYTCKFSAKKKYIIAISSFEIFVSRTSENVFWLLLLYLKNQGQVTRNPPSDAQIHLQFRHVQSFDIGRAIYVCQDP